MTCVAAGASDADSTGLLALYARSPKMTEPTRTLVLPHMICHPHA